jgi:hypothetical protein
VAPPYAQLAALSVLGAALVLAACGGSGTGRTTATVQQEDARRVAFARCLRQHGVDVTAGAGGAVTLSGKLDPQTVEAARTACKRYAPPAETANLTPRERVAREEAIEKFAKCMREHGIKLETSVVNGRIRLGGRAGGGSDGLNPSSPSFEAAMKACQGLLPMKGRRATRGASSGSGAPGDTGRSAGGGG